MWRFGVEKIASKTEAIFLYNFWYNKTMNLLKDQIKKFPNKTGVYFFKDQKNKILYIGKANSLRVRAGSYLLDHKRGARIDQMVALAKKVDFIETETEINALFLESELIKRYKPKYNVEWKDEKNYLFLKITKEDFPAILFTRNPVPDGSLYFGPFIDSLALRKSVRFLRKIFPIRTSGKFPHKKCFYGHLKMCPCYGIDKEEYKDNIKKLISIFKGKNKKVLVDLEKEMKKAAINKEFEKAATLRDKYFAFKGLKSKIILNNFSNIASTDTSLNEIKIILNLELSPKRIEAFDISNLNGQNAVGSCVVFVNGLPSKHDYRKFKIKAKAEPNDYLMMKELLTRRFKKKNNLPDLILVDGGKGQLEVGLNVLKTEKLVIPIAGIAKKEETIIFRKKNGYEQINLKKDSSTLFLVQRIRDEAHRFAVSYHRKLKRKAQTESLLEEIKGVGKKTAKSLLKKFGGIEEIKKTDLDSLAKITKSKAMATKILEKLNDS